MLWHQVLIHDIDASSGMEEIDNGYSVGRRIDDMISNLRLFRSWRKWMNRSLKDISEQLTCKSCQAEYLI